MSLLPLTARAAALAALGLALANPIPVSAAPKSKKGSAAKPVKKSSLPVYKKPPQKAVGVSTPKLAEIKPVKHKAKPVAGTQTPKLAKGARVALQRTSPLPKGAKLDLLEEAGLRPAGVKSTTKLTIRRPFEGTGAFMTLLGAAVVNPAEGSKGTAKIRGDMRDGAPEIGNPFNVNPIGLPEAPPPDYGIVVEFRAEKDRHYLVECAYAAPPRPDYVPPAYYHPLGASDFYTHVRDGGERLEGGLAVRDNLVVQVIPAQSRSRRVVVKVKSDHGFLTTGCSITPVTDG